MRLIGLGLGEGKGLLDLDWLGGGWLRGLFLLVFVLLLFGFLGEVVFVAVQGLESWVDLFDVIQHVHKPTQILLTCQMEDNMQLILSSFLRK